MKYIILGVMLLCMNHVTAQDKVRLKEKFDFDWKFILDDKKEYAQKSFIDTHWENIQVPHDWSIKLKFDKSVGGASAFIQDGIGRVSQFLHLIKIKRYQFYLMVLCIKAMFI